MSNVIVERPRVGRGWAAVAKPGRSRALVDDDGEPIRALKQPREAVKRAPKTKNLNETLNPLMRYLASNVGRPWNKVYSEISEHLKPTSTVQQHVRDHLDDFVATRTRMKNGVVMVATRFGGERSLAEDWSLFYVHPRTGLLRKNDKHKRFSAIRREARIKADAERAKRMRVIDANTQLHLLKGVWWEVKLAKIRQREKRDEHGRLYVAQNLYTDVVHSGKLSSLPASELYGVEGVYAAERRQLNKAEIKRLKLR